MSEQRLEIDVSTDFHSDVSPGTDPDSYSPLLREAHRRLWSKTLDSGSSLRLDAPARRRDGYLVHTDSDGRTTYFGSDAITNSYSRWSRPKSLVAALTSLSAQERDAYLNPPYTIGSAMIWPLRSSSRPTINQARGIRSVIADRMDLTLECVRRHYASESSPLMDVLTAYGDFFDRFSGFREFVDFFHLQDLVNIDYSEVQYLLPFNEFSRTGLPVTRDEYIAYREASLLFIAQRSRRMIDWLGKHSHEAE